MQSTSTEVVLNGRTGRMVMGVFIPDEQEQEETGLRIEDILSSEPPPRPVGDRWQPKEDQLVKLLYPKGHLNMLVAVLYRTDEEIKERAYELGCSPYKMPRRTPNAKYREWSPEEMRFMIANRFVMKSVSIAKVLGRTPASIATKFRELETFGIIERVDLRGKNRQLKGAL